MQYYVKPSRKGYSSIVKHKMHTIRILLTVDTDKVRALPEDHYHSYKTYGHKSKKRGVNQSSISQSGGSAFQRNNQSSDTLDII